MRVGSFEFWLLDLLIVIVIVIFCKIWDHYDVHKFKKLSQKTED